MRLLKRLLELGHAVMLGQFGGAGRGLRADFLGFVVKLVFVVVHAINLVSACAVKSTMGTTRA